MTRIARERRVHPRLEHKLPFNVAVNGYDFSTTTRNISCVGAYCHLDKYIPPFTKISVKLSLPANERAGKDTIVECWEWWLGAKASIMAGSILPSSLTRCALKNARKSPLI